MSSLPRRGLTPYEFDDHGAKRVLLHLLRKQLRRMSQRDHRTHDARRLQPTQQVYDHGRSVYADELTRVGERVGRGDARGGRDERLRHARRRELPLLLDQLHGGRQQP